MILMLVLEVDFKVFKVICSLIFFLSKVMFLLLFVNFLYLEDFVFVCGEWRLIYLEFEVVLSFVVVEFILWGLVFGESVVVFVSCLVELIVVMLGVFFVGVYYVFFEWIEGVIGLIGL